MAKCAYCNTTILFGGTKRGERRFCNAKCEQGGLLADLADQLPEEAVGRYIAEVHEGGCPRCHGPGPVDVHTSYRVWSALLLTSWASRPVVSCTGCGRKRKAGDAFFSLFLGWWGFPWGLIVTPIQVGRNVVGLFQTPDPATPSPALAQVARMELAAKVVEARRQEQATQLAS